MISGSLAFICKRHAFKGRKTACSAVLRNALVWAAAILIGMPSEAPAISVQIVAASDYPVIIEASSLGAPPLYTCKTPPVFDVLRGRYPADAGLAEPGVTVKAPGDRIEGLLFVVGGLLGLGFPAVLLGRRMRRGRDGAASDSLKEAGSKSLLAPPEMEAVLSAMTSLVLELGLDGVIIRVVPTAYRFRYDKVENLPGRHVCDYIEQLEPDEAGEILNRVCRLKRQETHQFRVGLDRDRRLSICLSPLGGDSVLAVASDITEIQESRRQYQELIELVNSIIFRLDQDGRISFINRYGEEFFGYSKSELIGRPAASAFMPGFDPVMGLNGNGPEKFSDKTIELENYKRNGDRVFVSYRTRTLWGGEQPVGALWVGYDVTEQRLASEKLKKRERYYCSLIERTSDLITLIDADGRIVSAGPAVERILGFSRDENVGALFADFIHPDDLKGMKVFFKRVLEGGAAQELRHEHRLRHKDGTWLHFESLAVNLLEDEAVASVVINSRNITDRLLFEEELRKQSFYDTLTGLPNHALLMERLKHAIERYRRRQGRAYSVLCVDVDRFKMINDSLGRQVGDQLLSSIAELLAGHFRKVDTVARFGSDEFVILIDEIEDDRTPIKMAERIMEQLKKPMEIEGHEVFASVTIGIAYGSPEYNDPLAILRDADTAMHRAKIEAKGGYRIFRSTMHNRVRELLKLETDLRRALERGEFEVHYQPIIDMRDGRAASFEALIRWRRPNNGLASPMQFIPTAEETGLIRPIGEWIMEQACLETREVLNSYGNGRGQLSLNLSARQFLDAGLVGSILNILDRTGMEPSRVKLEITETTIMENAAKARQVIEELKWNGISIAIDDFGTGYSSLSYLQQFPFDTLKIDRSFIGKLHNGRDKEINIVRIILSLARAFGMDVVAEGIETPAQREILLDLGCNEGQGFLFAKPMDIGDLKKYLAEKLLVS